jgi:predicted HD phosphohydrolase
MIAAGLLHDIGKPFTADQSKDDDVLNDTYSFKNHEEISFQIIKNWWFVSDYTKNLVRYHYLIRDMSKSKINDLKRYNRLKKVWDKLPDEFKADLNIFLICDDLGK